jgi:hypothetical protein
MLCEFGWQEHASIVTLDPVPALTPTVNSPDWAHAAIEDVVPFVEVLHPIARAAVDIAVARAMDIRDRRDIHDVHC